MTEQRWRDVRMPPDSLRGELYEKLRTAQADSPGAPQAWIAPTGWWPDVVRVLGLPVVRRVGVTELTVSMDDPEEARPVTTAKQIVRALATERAPIDTEYDRCHLCGQQFDHEESMDGGADAVERHQPTCPWRQAREWVAAHPEATTVSDPWTRHSLYRLSDGALIIEYVNPPGQVISWSPGLGFDPQYPDGYEWRVVEIPGSSTAADPADNVTHTAGGGSPSR